MNRRVFLCVGLALCAACALPPTAPQTSGLPASVHTVAVFPPNNRTGDALLITGASFVEKYVLPTERYTVGDALAAEARVQLERQGFSIVAPQQVDTASAGRTPSNGPEAATWAAHDRIEAAVLYIEIKRWEADAPFQPQFVIVSVTATLIDTASGRVVWTADHPSRPVPTPGVVTVGDAYGVAAHRVMVELLGSLSDNR